MQLILPLVPSGASKTNEKWKVLDYKVNSITHKLRHPLSRFGKVELPSNLNNEESEGKIREKSELLEEIEQLQFELEKLKAERKKHPRHISFEELPEDLKFERLKPSKRLFFDTVKMLVYRAEDLLTILNESKTLYPGTDMKLLYSLTGKE